jgi:hypothetical protein
MHTTKGAIKDDIHHLAPFGIAHIADGFFTPERRVVDQNIDAPEPLERGPGKRTGSFFIADIAKNGDRFAALRVGLWSGAVAGCGRGREHRS